MTERWQNSTCTDNERQQSQLRKKERNCYSVQPNDDMGALS